MCTQFTGAALFDFVKCLLSLCGKPTNGFAKETNPEKRKQWKR